MPKISLRNYRITIEEDVAVEDVMGGTTPDWQTVVSCYAGMRSQFKPGEKMVAGASQLQSTTTYIFTLRRRSGIRADMRILHEGRTFVITSVSDPGSHGSLMQLYAEELY